MSSERSSRKVPKKEENSSSASNGDLLRLAEASAICSPEMTKNTSPKLIKMSTEMEHQDSMVDINVKSIMAGVKDMKIQVTAGCRVYELKLAIFDRCELLPKNQVLLYQDKKIDRDDVSIDTYGLTPNCTIMLNVKLATGLPLPRPSRPWTELLLLAPKLFEDEGNGKGVRKIVRELPTIAQQLKKVSAKEQKETDKTRAKMKDLLSRRAEKKLSLISSGSSLNSIASSCSSTFHSPLVTDEVSEDELKYFHECPETQETEIKEGRAFFVPPQDYAELEQIKKFLENKAKDRCKLCKKRLSPIEQSLSCLCMRYFCKKHRMPKDHRCIITYKQITRNAASKTLSSTKK